MCCNVGIMSAMRGGETKKKESERSLLVYLSGYNVVVLYVFHYHYTPTLEYADQ